MNTKNFALAPDSSSCYTDQFEVENNSFRVSEGHSGNQQQRRRKVEDPTEFGKVEEPEIEDFEEESGDRDLFL